MSGLSLVLDTPGFAEKYEQPSGDRQFKHGKELIEDLEIGSGARVPDIGSSLARNAGSQGSTAPSAAVVDRNSRPVRSGRSSHRRLIPVLGLNLAMALALISIPAWWPPPLPDFGTVGERTTQLLAKARSWFEPKPASASVAPPTDLAARL